MPLATVEKVLRLYREQYFDYNVKHFTEEVQKEHRIKLGYTWIKTALQTAELVAPTRKRGRHRKKRPRRALPGMLLHVDGSPHAWLPGAGQQDLIAVLDDATNEVYYAQLVEEDSGRCERFFGTWQGRLPQELRRRKITTLEKANRFLRDSWIPYHREHFTVPSPQVGTAFVPYAGAELEKIFSRQEDRVVRNDNTVPLGKLTLQIEPQPFRFSLAGCRVLVCRHLDDTLSLHYGPHLLGRYDAQGELLSAPSSRRKKRVA